MKIELLKTLKGVCPEKRNSFRTRMGQDFAGDKLCPSNWIR